MINSTASKIIYTFRVNALTNARTVQNRFAWAVIEKDTKKFVQKDWINKRLKFNFQIVFLINLQFWMAMNTIMFFWSVGAPFQAQLSSSSEAGWDTCLTFRGFSLMQIFSCLRILQEIRNPFEQWIHLNGDSPWKSRVKLLILIATTTV